MLQRAHLSLEQIFIRYHVDGRATGEAFVDFRSAQMAQAAAADMDRKNISCGGTSRYIEIFPSSPEEKERRINH